MNFYSILTILLVLDYLVSYLTFLYPEYLTDRGFANHSITVTNKPLPFTAADKIKFSEIYISPGYFTGLFVTFGFAFFVSSFIVLEVQEKSFKHLQVRTLNF